MIDPTRIVGDDVSLEIDGLFVMMMMLRLGTRIARRLRRVGARERGGLVENLGGVESRGFERREETRACRLHTAVLGCRVGF